jgi:hypothetical protein
MPARFITALIYQCIVMVSFNKYKSSMSIVWLAINSHCNASRDGSVLLASSDYKKHPAIHLNLAVDRAFQHVIDACYWSRSGIGQKSELSSRLQRWNGGEGHWTFSSACLIVSLSGLGRSCHRILLSYLVLPSPCSDYQQRYLANSKGEQRRAKESKG